MPALLEIANDLAKTFVKANNKRHAAKRIVNEINCLVYSSPKQPVNDSLKIMIMQVIYELICGKIKFQSNDDEAIFIESENISVFAGIMNKFSEELYYRNQ